MFDCNSELLAIEEKGLVTVIDFEKKTASRFNTELPNGVLKLYIAKNDISFVRRSSG